MAALSARYPQIKPNMIDRYVTKYITAVMAEIATQYMCMKTDDVEMDFAVDAVNQASGRYKIAGVVGSVYTLMQQHMSTSLVVVMYEGNSYTHRVSRVVFNHIYKKEIMETLGSLTIECDPTRLQALNASSNISVQVDLESLASYIAQTRMTLKQGSHIEAYEEKLTRNLLIATQLVGLARVEDGVAYLDEYWEYIDSGRMHGHGLSLQRIPKEVRHAALGHCYRYDFKAASYAIMTSLAMQIDPTLKTVSLQDYIRYRSAIRKRIAKDIGISEDWMKGIFTAIGFGAELKDNPHNAIRKKLGQEKYYKLMCNAEFSYIVRELAQVSATILNHVGKGDFELMGLTYNETNPKDGIKRTKNQKLAWIYQCLESDALKVFASLIPEAYNVKLLVHDCVYVEQRLASQTLNDIAYGLRQKYPLLSFEGEKITPIQTADFVSAKDREIDRFEKEHKVSIAKEQSAAVRQYAGSSGPHLSVCM